MSTDQDSLNYGYGENEDNILKTKSASPQSYEYDEPHKHHHHNHSYEYPITTIPIESVFGRIGIVEAKSSDYSKYYQALSSTLTEFSKLILSPNTQGYVTWDGATLAISSGGQAGTGTVTSVGLSAPSTFSVSGSPITGFGTLSFSWNGSSANFILADGSTVPTSTYALASSLSNYATTAALASYQPLDADLTAIAALGGLGLLRKTGSNTWTLDTTAYLTPTSNAATASKLLSPVNINGVSFDGSSSISFNSDSVAEGSTNQYFTQNKVLSTSLTGYSLGSNSAILATDTLVAAFGKIQAQINNVQPSNAILQSISNLSQSQAGLIKLTNGVASFDSNVYALSSALANYQPIDADLTAIAGLVANTGILRKTAANTWSLDTNTYLTSNQSITISGDASGSGSTSISLTVGKILGITIPAASTGNLRYNGSALIWDATTYLTSNQSITWTPSGDVSGSASGTTAISPALVVTGIQGKSITLATGFLKYNGSSWSFDNSSYQPLASNLTTLAALGNPAANGYVLSSTTAGVMSWVPVSGGGGTVTSVGLTAPTIFTVSSSPITTNGSLSFTWNGSNLNFVLADGSTVSTSTYALASALSSYLTTANASTTYLSITTAANTYQPVDADLTSIAGLSGTNGWLKKTAANTWALDTSTFLTGNQSITWTSSGDVSGSASGATSITPSLTVTGIQGKAITLASGLLRYNGTAFSFDSSTYLTANQTITLSGDVSGSGTTAITAIISASTVTGKALTGYSVGSNTVLAATDTILAAFGKIQAQLNATPGTVTSVALSAPTIFNVSGSPVTGNGSLSFSWNGSSTNFVLADGTTVSTSTYALASALASYLTTTAAASSYQPLDGDLTSIAGLAGLTGLARKTAANTWSLDTNTYLTANQSITWTGSGDVSGTASGSTSISPSITVTAIQGKSITLAQGFLKYNGTSWIFDNSTYLTTSSASSSYQPLATNLTTFATLGNPAANGYVLSSTTAGVMSWVPVSGGGGTVTSVGLTAPSIFTVSNSPVTTNGNISFVWNGASSNFVLGDGSTVSTSTYALASALSSYLTISAASSTYQPLDADLTAIAALSGTSGWLKKTAANTWALDTSTFLTGNQSITWTASGDISGSASGATSISPSLTVTGIQGKAITLASGLLRYNGTSFSFDSSTFLTANQNITLSGDVSGSGATSISVTVNKILGNAIPANASGALTNNGTGTLSWVNYLTTAPTITLTGVVTGSGTGSFATSFATSPTFTGILTTPNLTLSGFSTGTLINTSGVVSALSGTNIVLGNGNTIPQSTFILSSTNHGIESTGIYSWASPCISIAGNTTFNVTAVYGQIVDTTTTPGTPIITQVYYPGGTNITDLYVTTSKLTYIYLDNTGTLRQSSTILTHEQRRNNIFLGEIVHPSSTIITSVDIIPDICTSALSQTRELWDSIKFINNGVIAYANGANLNLNITGGYFYGRGINWANNPLEPMRKSVGPYIAVSFKYGKQIGGVGASTIAVDPANWDNAGVTTAVGGGAGSSTNQYIYMGPSGQVILMYGQHVYSTFAAAIAAISNESFIVPDTVTNTLMLIGVLTVNKNATQLNDPNQAHFTSASKFGELASGSAGSTTATLQNIYDNSTIPQILTSSAIGALTIKRGSTSDTDSVFSLQNGSGVGTFSVNGNGVITSGSWNGSLVGVSYGGTGLSSLGTIGSAILSYSSASNGFIKWNGSSLSIDSSTYLTSNQSITLSGAITGTGSTSITTTLGAGVVGLSNLSNLAANSVIANVTGASATPTAVSLLSTATASSVALRDSNANIIANNMVSGYNTTVTAAGTTTLTAASAQCQFFTGSQNQTVVLPAAATLTTGYTISIYNKSSGIITVQTSGGNTMDTLYGTTLGTNGGAMTYVCIVASGTGSSSWGKIGSFSPAIQALATSLATNGVNGSFTNTNGVFSYTPMLPLIGGTLTGKLTVPASAAGSAGFSLQQGAAPTAPVDGDFWITSSGVFAQAAGSTLKLNANGALYYSSTSAVYITNTVTASSLGSTSLSSAAMTPGNVVSVLADGYVKYNTLSDSVAITVRVATTDITFNVVGSSIPSGVVNTNYHWKLDGRLTPATGPGAGSTVKFFGRFSVVGTGAEYISDISQSMTIDTSTSITFDLRAQWSGTGANNSIGSEYLVVQQINSIGGGGGSVISVALTAPSLFTATGSPITSSGTLGFSWNGSSSNLVRADGSTVAQSTFLSTAPTITLTGEVTGTGTGSFATTLASSISGTKTFGGLISSGIMNTSYLSLGYQAVVTAAGTTTLTATSPHSTEFTGTTTQTCVLPDSTTLTVGRRFEIGNNSTGLVTVNTNGGATLLIMAAGTTLTLSCTSTATAAGTWKYDYFGATAASGKKLLVNNTLTLTGTDGTSHTFPTTTSVLARTDAAQTFSGNQSFSGNVYYGSGTLSFIPAAPLNMLASSAGTVKTQINVINTGGGAGAGAAIDFFTYDVSGGTTPGMRLAALDNSYSADFVVYTKVPGAPGNSLSERFRVANGGVASFTNTCSSVNFLEGYTTTATAAGTTTLTVSSTYQQYFTGTTTQTVTLPVTSTLVLGQAWYIQNNSTGLVTVNSSGANAVVVLASGTSAIVTCILLSGTTAASWSVWYEADVMASGKKLVVNNSLTLAGTDATTMTFPSTSATIAGLGIAQTFSATQTFSAQAAFTSTTDITVGTYTTGSAYCSGGLSVTKSLQAKQISETVQTIAVGTSVTANLANGNIVILGTSGVPGALTAATTVTFQNPIIGSTTQLTFKQFTTSVAVTFTISGYTFYQNGKTSGVASGSAVLLAADMTLSCQYTAFITWASSTSAIVNLMKT